jgi:hypothetical protein
MARGHNFNSTYSLSRGGQGFCSGNGPTDIGLAQFVLEQFGIPVTGGSLLGEPLNGYDIKSQEALQILKLSLLAYSNGEKFIELYADSAGGALVVEVGETEIDVGDAPLLHKNSISSSKTEINHVVVHAKAPFPFRTYGGTVDIMGRGVEKQYRFDCVLPSPGTKQLTFQKESWVEFERSEQSKETQDLLKAAVNRERWENLIGYRARFASIPIWATMSPSPTSPDVVALPNTSFSSTPVTFDNYPDSGGVVDVSGISMASTPVLDIQYGADLIKIAQSLGIDDLDDDSGAYFTDLNEDDYFVLLGHECGMNSLSRGTNWYLLPTGDPNTALVQVRESSANAIAMTALGGFTSTFAGPSAQTELYRAENGFIGNFQEMMKTNLAEGRPLLAPHIGVATKAGIHGNLVAGFGGNLGIEVWGLNLTYTKQTPCIQIKSQNNDAWSIASSVAAEGVNYSALVVVEEPPCAGLAPGGGPVCPVPPPNDETEQYCPETALDTLEGSVIEMSAPWLDKTGAQEFANNLYTLVSTESPDSATYTYARGGQSVYPGMSFNGQIVHSVEFSYADKSSQTTTITTGPKFYQSGSAGGDSRYIKRSETINKPGVVIGGHNESGTFSVNVDGLGIYEAINGQIDPIYPGDRVEVKIMNYPIER